MCVFWWAMGARKAEWRGGLASGRGGDGGPAVPVLRGGNWETRGGGGGAARRVGQPELIG